MTSRDVAVTCSNRTGIIPSPFLQNLSVPALPLECLLNYVLNLRTKMRKLLWKQKRGSKTPKGISEKAFKNRDPLQK